MHELRLSAHSLAFNWTYLLLFHSLSSALAWWSLWLLLSFARSRRLSLACSHFLSLSFARSRQFLLCLHFLSLSFARSRRLSLAFPDCMDCLTDLYVLTFVLGCCGNGVVDRNQWDGRWE